MSMRWSKEEIAAFQKRADSWQKTVRTHQMDGSQPRMKNASKYGNVRAEADGMKFDCKREAKRWMDLRLMEKAKQISDLERQVRYELSVNAVHVCDYVADFVYRRGGEVIVEDSKGALTPVFNLKEKLMFAIHGITILKT